MKNCKWIMEFSALTLFFSRKIGKLKIDNYELSAEESESFKNFKKKL